jgi:hypothetical protein
MFKLLATLVAFLLIGAAVIQQRHEQIELRNRMANLHRELQRGQSELWRQQLDIATYTSPSTIQKLVPRNTPQTNTIDESSVNAARE